MSPSAIVIINPGQVMAAAYKKDLLEIYNSSGSMTGADPKTGLTTERLAGSELASAIEAADTNLRDRFRAYWVTEEHKEPDEQQPFSALVNEQGKTLVYALVEGSFEKYATDDAKMGVEATFFEDWLAGKLSAVWAGCNGSVKKLFQLLDTAKFKTDVQAEMGTRGVIALINNEEAPLWISKGNADTVGKFTWGETSNKLTYTEPKAKEPDAPAKIDLSAMTYKERKLFLQNNPNFKPGDAAPAAPEPDKGKPSVPTVVPEGVEPEKVTETGTIGIKKGKRYLYAPLSANAEERKQFYGKHGGSSKDYDHKNNAGIPIEKIVKSSHFYAMVHGPAAKDTDAHGAIDKTIYPILTGPEIGEAFNVIKGSTGYKDTEELFNTFNKDHPAFTERLNKTLDDYPLLLRMQFGDMFKLSHKALANLCHELRIAYVKDHPGAFGGTQVIAAPDKDKPEDKEVKVEEKVEEPKKLSDMTYKERKAYLKEHPEAASAA